MKYFFLILSLILPYNTSSQGPDSSSDIDHPYKLQKDLWRQLKQQLEEEQGQIKSFFKDNFFENLEKRFFGNDSHFFKDFERYFDEGGIGQLFQGMGTPQTEWRENEREKTLVIKGVPIEKDPLKISLKDNLVTISGSLKVHQENIQKGRRSQTQRIYQFAQTFNVPAGTDPNKVKVENKQGEVRIIFPKESSWQESPSRKLKDRGTNPLKNQKEPRTYPRGTKPLQPGSDDLSI